MEKLLVLNQKYKDLTSAMNTEVVGKQDRSSSGRFVAASSRIQLSTPGKVEGAAGAYLQA